MRFCKKYIVIYIIYAQPDSSCDCCNKISLGFNKKKIFFFNILNIKVYNTFSLWNVKWDTAYYSQGIYHICKHVDHTITSIEHWSDYSIDLSSKCSIKNNNIYFIKLISVYKIANFLITVTEHFTNFFFNVRSLLTATDNC